MAISSTFQPIVLHEFDQLCQYFQSYRTKHLAWIVGNIMSTLDWLSQVHSKVGSLSDWRSRGHKFESQLSHITFMEIDHEIISTVILPLELLEEGQLSVYTLVLVNYLED